MVDRKIVIETAKSFIEECKTHGVVFSKVFLFGSFAKGTFDNWSDIDLLLISDKFNENVFDNLKLYSAINIKYPRIETHPYPLDYYKNGDPFLNEILKESIEIV